MALVRKEFDVSLAQGDVAGVGMDIASSLQSKGFCVLDAAFAEDDLRQARESVDEADARQKLYRPPELIVEGLLGAEGSARLLELGRPDVDEGEAPTGLRKLDVAMSETAAVIGGLTPALGFECPTRTHGLVSETGMAGEEAPELGLEEASVWLSTLCRHKLMIIVPLGPIKGTLELRPFDEEAEVFEVPTNPGSMIILRCDAMTHRHFAHSKACLLSCFLLEAAAASKYQDAMMNISMTPAALEIHNWAMTRMKELKEEEYEYKVPADIPAAWLTAMNHTFHCVQRAAVRGIAGRYASSYNVHNWYKSMNAGVDFVTEIPMARWRWEEYFDSDFDSWRWGKTFLKHGSFMDGAELFDNKFFSLSPAEAGGMDPHQREVLEVGYDALASAGYKKGKLMNSLGGVYLGSSMTIFGQVSQVSGATGGAASINSNRFSFCLGLKGPSMTVDTEGSSGLTAIYIGADACLDKGRGTNNHYSLSGGVSFQLGTIWWPQLQAANLLSPQGRCMSWDQSADGYCMADGCGFAVLKRQTDFQDGAHTTNEGEPWWGTIAAATCNSNGLNVTMKAPNGPAEQEMVAEAVRNAGLNPMNIDSVETHSQGHFMADAIEVDSLMRVLRGEEVEVPLCLTGVKSQTGHGHEAAGIMGFHRGLLTNLWGTVTPNCHLCQINPHMEPENKANYMTEALEFTLHSSYTGITSRGFGGTNVHVITTGECDQARLRPVPEEFKREALAFWPGGGGQLEEGAEPYRAYCIAGTCTGWEPVPMESEAEAGSFGFTVTLGENRWEDFQVLLDGDRARCLHPAMPKAFKGAQVQGPDFGVQGLNWRIAGSQHYLTGLEALQGEGAGPEEGALAIPSADLQVLKLGVADAGQVGDQYRVHLKCLGKFRTVQWEKIGHVDPSTLPASEYHVTADWNAWTFDKMEKEGDIFTLEVVLLRAGGEFQLARNGDTNQTICPPWPRAESTEPAYGPDGGVAARGCNWALGGKPGDVYKISFDRSAMKVTWEKVREEKLTDDQLSASSRPRVSVVGSWAGWVRQVPLAWGGRNLALPGAPAELYFFVQMGADAQESFQLLEDYNWDAVLHPNRPVTHPEIPHTLMMSPNDGYAMNLVWTIGPDVAASPGEVFHVKVTYQGGRVRQVAWDRAQGGPQVEEAAATGGILKRG
mmetsp:Transcript_93964/g.265926  ORF Transcript_93964/g.265926 Transcript_93964/m.265926 type:complete len:1160 (+) Transcript_93964:86-3565(+)